MGGRDHREELVHRFFSGTGPTYDYMVDLLTWGTDTVWKEKILEKLQQPSRVLDLACGTGILTFAIARRYSGSQVIGVEMREEYLDIARRKAQNIGLTNVDFLLSRAEDVVLDDSFDHITSSYLAKYADLRPLTKNMVQMLQEGGLLLFHEFTYPSNRLVALALELYYKLLQIVGTRKYHQWREIFYGLRDVVRRTTWVPDVIQAMQENHLSDIRVEPLSFGISAIVTGRKRT